MSLLSRKKPAPPPSPSSSINSSNNNNADGDNDQQREDKAKIWINAWYDPLANICALPGCMTFSDINGDGNSKLILLNSGNNPLLRNRTSISSHKMKVYKGTSIISENILLEEPVAVASYHQDYKTPRRATIAVASGCHVFLYQNLQPHHKFTVPSNEIHADEKTIWENLKVDKYDAKTAFEELLRLRDLGIHLSLRSYEVLSMNDPNEIQAFMAARKLFPLFQQTSITCMSVISKDKDEVDAIGCLVIGTESRKILILNPSGVTVTDSVMLPSVPVHIVTSGSLDIDSRIVVICRDNNVYTIKNKKISGVVIELDTHAVGLQRIEKNIAIGLINNVISCFSSRGRKQYCIYMPCAIKAMGMIDMVSSRSVKCLLVALENRELRVYNGKSLVNVIETSDVVSSMCFGTYGSEPNCLALSYRNGGTEFKVLSRMAKLETPIRGGSLAEQDTPLNLPVRTTLYMDQTEREKKYGTEMHRIFQKELCKVRLTTARAFVKILTDGQGPLSYTSGASIRLTASVQGLGPIYKIKLDMQNTGVKPMNNISILYSYNQDIYSMRQSKMNIPCLLPGVQYEYEGEVVMSSHVADTMGDDSGPIADIVKVFVCSASSSIPLITAVVQMPIPEFDFLIPQ